MVDCIERTWGTNFVWLGTRRWGSLVSGGPKTQGCAFGTQDWIPIAVLVPKGRPQTGPGWSDVSQANIAQPWVRKVLSLGNPKGVALTSCRQNGQDFGLAGHQLRFVALGSVSKVCRRPESERTSRSARRPKQAYWTYGDAGQRSGRLVQPLEARHPEFSNKA